MKDCIVPETRNRKEIDLLSYSFSGYATCVHHAGEKLPVRGMFARTLNHHLPPMPENWVWVCQKADGRYSNWRLETLCDYDEKHDDGTREEYIFGKEDA